MPALADVLNAQREPVAHTVYGYKLWASPAVFGEGPTSPKEQGPAWKYQTTATICLLGCAVFANVAAMANVSGWAYPKQMDVAHDFSQHLLGTVLCLVCLGLEVEWVQLLSVIGAMRDYWWRGLLYALLASCTYEARKAFLYFEYTEYVCAGLLVVAAIYCLFGVYYAIGSGLGRQKYDESL
jgi:hypothetical protein